MFRRAQYREAAASGRKDEPDRQAESTPSLNHILHHKRTIELSSTTREIGIRFCSGTRDANTLAVPTCQETSDRSNLRKSE